MDADDNCSGPAAPKVYFRRPGVVAAGSASRYIVLKPKEEPFIFESPVSAIVAHIMSLVAQPISDAVMEEALTGRIPGATALLADLVERKVIVRTSPSGIQALFDAIQPPPVQSGCGRLVIGVCGAVQAALVAPYIDRIYFNFCRDLDFILTESSLNFVNPQAFKYLYNARVWVDTFQHKEGTSVPHIELARAADIIVVFPATAHLLHRLAYGSCCDLLSLTITATRAPVLLVPAMNSAMWLQPSVQRNVKQLREDGFYLVEPGLAFEVANKDHAALELGGPGVDPAGLVTILSLLLNNQTMACQST